jgi:predicted aldo/keto reductase-like oxidoreductase
MAIEEKLNQSLDERCRKLKRDFVDFFILHGYIIPVDWQNSLRPKVLPFQPINTP